MTDVEKFIGYFQEQLDAEKYKKIHNHLKNIALECNTDPCEFEYLFLCLLENSDNDTIQALKTLILKTKLSHTNELSKFKQEQAKQRKLL